MNTKHYIALVEKDFIFNQAVESYFKNMNIDVVHYYKNLNVLHLKSSHLLNESKLKYVSHLELNKTFSEK